MWHLRLSRCGLLVLERPICAVSLAIDTPFQGCGPEQILSWESFLVFDTHFCILPASQRELFTCFPLTFSCAERSASMQELPGLSVMSTDLTDDCREAGKALQGVHRLWRRILKF